MIDLAKALDVAIEAARAGGAILREEFHRAGGPRGSGGHAPVDEVVERLIRERLLGEFPTFGFLGEEEGAHGPGDAVHRWVVDPNDGTRSYLRGLRGSSISIALVHGGLPILGVVFAPVAPDDDGDLIAWAEGMPLLRNGKVVQPKPLAERLEAGQVVLVSQDADRNAAANARCVAPARFRAVPSIAYRLALVAAGEGDAAVSLNNPVDWDLAGGHALLRGAGGDLVTEGGQPIRYDRRGAGGRVFGASPALARQLAARPWESVFARGAAAGELKSLHPPVVPSPGRSVRSPLRLARAQGCLLGQVAGDSLGSLVEFRSAVEIAATYPGGVRNLADGGTWNTHAGQPTDDSELALLLGRCLVRGFDRRAIEKAYRDWLGSYPFDVGNTTRQGIMGVRDFASQANGGLMRVAPLGIYGHALETHELAELARSECELTHPHAICRDASAAFTIAVAHAIRGHAGPQEMHGAALSWCRDAGAAVEVVRTIEAAAAEPPADYQRQQGWVLIALQNAFFQLLHAKSLEEGVISTVMAGGDTDTNAAIAGALLGAAHGRDAVPLRWRNAVLSCRPIETGLQQRPRPFWPVDLLELAEALLLAGEGRRLAQG